MKDKGNNKSYASVVVKHFLLLMVFLFQMGACRADESPRTDESLPPDVPADSINRDCDCSTDDLFLNPFNKNSAYHRPIGTGAIYADDTDPATIDWLKADGIAVNADNGWGHKFTRNSVTDPLMTITFDISTPPGYGNGTGLPVTLRVPPEFDGGGTSDGAASIYDAATNVIHAFYRLAPPKAALHYTVNPRGLGHHGPGETETGRMSTSASGMAQTGNLLRGHEVNTPGFRIQHALNITLPARPKGHCAQMLSKDIIWPASSRDGFASNPENNNGHIPYGGLLAIPPVSKGGPNLDSLGLSEPGRRVAQALRDYGMYVMDTSDCPAMRGDQYINSSVILLIKADLKKIYRFIRMVKNTSSGQVVKGGGEPLAPNCAFDAK